MLELRNVCKSYGSQPVLSNVNFTVPEGGRICVCGPSGCGKTTLIRIILGLEKADSGEVIKPRELRTSVVFQEDRLLPWKTALDNITAVGVEKKAAAHCLELVGLSSDADKYPGELSGGMKRRLCCARALAYNGELVVLDEPFTGLDDEAAESMARLIRKETQGKTVIMITHDADAADILGAGVYTLN